MAGGRRHVGVWNAVSGLGFTQITMRKTVVYSTTTKNSTLVACNNVDESQNNYADCRKQDKKRKEDTVYDSVYIKF